MTPSTGILRLTGSGASSSNSAFTPLYQLAKSVSEAPGIVPAPSSTPISQRICSPLAAFACPAIRRAAFFTSSGYFAFSSTRVSSTGYLALTLSTIVNAQFSISLIRIDKLRKENFANK